MFAIYYAKAKRSTINKKKSFVIPNTKGRYSAQAVSHEEASTLVSAGPDFSIIIMTISHQL